MKNTPRINVLGVGISVTNLREAQKTIKSWIVKGETHYVCITGVHGVMESQRDKRLKIIHNSSGLTTPDGMPMVWIGKLLGYEEMGRVYGPSLMLGLCEAAAKNGYTNFFYGGKEGVPEELEKTLQQSFPRLKIAGTYSPPFRSLTREEDEHIVEMINTKNPDILWVGLSTPKQEVWMYQHREVINARVMIGVGAAFDFYTRRVRQAPLWMQCSGLEWLFRLIQEPKRLWKRYLINNPSFVYNLFLQFTRLKRFNMT